MTFRSKILAAVLGLAMASGTVGGAFAQAGDAPKTPAPAVATKTAPKATVVAKSHRLHVAHRGVTKKLTAHRVVPSAKVATTKIGAKQHLVRSRLARTHLAKATVGTTATSKIRVSKRLVGSQKHAMIAKKSIVR